MKRYIEKRGVRIPEDRLRAGLWFTGLVSPIGFLMYGWSVQHEKGGMAVPIVGMVLTGMAQMAGFSALNTYCAGNDIEDLFVFVRMLIRDKK